MSFHPLNPEMVFNEGMLISGGTIGGFAMKAHGHFGISIALWAVAGLYGAVVGGSMISDRTYPLNETLRMLFIGLLVGAIIAGVAWWWAG
jgi:predicted branched-subunit amino acid permease